MRAGRRGKARRRAGARFGASPAVLLVVMLAGAAPAARAVSFSWGQPVLVDHQPPFADSSYGLSGLSCPTTGLCVALSSTDVVTWPNPGQGRPAVRAVQVTQPEQCDVEVPEQCSGVLVNGVSCPSVTFCAVAAGGADVASPIGYVFSSANPPGGASAWNGGGFSDPGNDVTGVSCASTALCVAVDDAGNIFNSTNPAGASPTWTSTSVPGAGEFGAVSCPSAALCVAVDGAGNVVSSSDPAGGASSWTVAQVDAGRRLTSISCAAPSLCVAVDGAGNVVSSSDPAGGASSWTVAQVDRGHSLNRVSCPGVSLCVAVDGAGNVISSSDPADGAAAWAVAHIDSSALIDVSCPSASVCVTLDSAGQAPTSTDPSGGAAAWTAYDLGAHNILEQVACPSRPLCVAIDDAGNVISSRDPTSATARWTVARVDPGAGPNAGSPFAFSYLSCPAASLCVAGDNAGRVFASGNPAGGAHAWTRARYLPVGDISCASIRRKAVCVGDGTRDLLVSTRPLRGRWKRARINRYGPDAVSCAPQLPCFALDGGLLYSSADPAAGPRAWHSHRGPPGQGYPLGLWCPSARLCLAAAEYGAGDPGECATPNSATGINCLVLVDAAADPAGGRPRWTTVFRADYGTSAFADPATAVAAISCPAASLCFLLNGPHSLISTDPARGARAWRQVQIAPGGGVTGVACPSARVCVAVDDHGDVIQGRLVR